MMNMNLSGTFPGEHSGASSSNAQKDPKKMTVKDLINDLQSPATREHALQVLSQNRLIRDDLAPWLWESFGTVSILLQEVISVYYSLSSASLLERQANRVCNALALLQCVASHPDTRKRLINANIPYYLYPFLNTTNKEKPFEFIRLTTLGVIGALVKSDDAGVIHFLLETQVFPCCLRCMEVGNVLSQTVATFIVNKILQHDLGLKYCCSIADRFYAISKVLRIMVEKLAVSEEPNKRLLKHIICCYQRLSEDPRACDGLRAYFPFRLRENIFINVIRDDPAIMNYLQSFMYNVSMREQPRTQPPVGELYGRLRPN